jgi:hypothetical protein
LRTAVERGLVDAKFGSQVGTLLLQRRLTPAEAATAFRVAEIYGRFEGQNGLRRSTRSPSYESGRLGSGGSLEQLSDEAAQRIADIHAQWLALQASIEDLYPDSVRAFFQMRGLLEGLCVEDTTVPAIHLPHVISALRKLGKFFNSARGRPKKRRKRSSAPIVNGSPTTTPATRPTSTSPRRHDHEREAWLKVQRRLSPTLDERQLQQAYEIFLAMKEREAFNAGKTTGGR